MPFYIQLPDIKRIECRAVGAAIILSADDGRRVIVLGLLYAVNIWWKEAVADQVNRHIIRIEEELHSAGVGFSIDHLVLLERIHADAILIDFSEIAGGQNIRVLPDAILWIVREEGSTWQVRIGLRKEGIAVVGAGRVTGLGDCDTVPVLRTGRSELAEQPAVSKLIVNHDWVAGIVGAVRD